MTTLAILGGGGHGSDILGLIEACHPHTDVSAVVVGDDNWTRPERFDRRSVTLLGISEAIERCTVFVGAAGYPGPRRMLVERALGAGAKPSWPLVHPRAEVSTGVVVSDGAVVQGLAWLSPLCSVGAHAYVGYGAKVGHDTAVGPFSSLMPGCCIGGDAVLGAGVLIGAGAFVAQGVTVGDGAVVGAGATVLTDVPPNRTVIGTPATEARSR